MIQARDLPLLVVFASVARNGSFTAAARELGLGKSVVSEHVRALEERLGVQLLERTTRRLRLTQVGEQVERAAAGVVDAARDVDSVLEEHKQAPVGTLRVASTHDLGARLVAPVAARLAVQHPQLRVDLVNDDATQDLVGGRFDVAVRLGVPKDSQFPMRRLSSIPEHLVAAPALAERFARATRPGELTGAPWVRHSVVGPTGEWRFQGPRGEADGVVPNVRAQANTSDGVRALLLTGVGMGCLPDYLVAEDLRRGALVRVCPEWVWKVITLYAVLPSSRRRPKRVELFLAALKDALAAAGLADGDAP